MHLIVPFAGTVSEAGRQALQTLALPQLERLLAQLAPAQTLGSDEFSMSPPHELARAAALGWPLVDGALPWGAELAMRAGLPTADLAWAMLEPVHLHAGSDHVRLTDPAGLALDDATSQVLLEAVRHLFESEGFQLHRASATQWLAAHPIFDGLATASLDRVVSRNVDPWLPDHGQARLLRRLQNEVQMVFYTHPLNDQRESAGLPTINSFWCSGCGRLPRLDSATGALDSRLPAAEAPVVDDRLRAPALGEDWAAWCEAWRALDAGPIAELLRSPGEARITLCGERIARRWEPAPRSLWQRVAGSFQRTGAPHFLEPL
jgi:hypothetical protein